jgi:hypothetical protein
MTVLRATPIGDLGHMMSIPRKCTNSALYFRAGSFPVGIKGLTHSYSTGDEHVKVKHRTVWVVYLDAWQGQISIIIDPGDGNGSGMTEKKRYYREQLLTASRNNKWRQRKQYTLPETSKLPLTRTHKYKQLSHIPRTLCPMHLVTVK